MNKTFLAFLIYSLFCMFTFVACEEGEGVQDEVIVELDGSWTIDGEFFSDVTFDSESEMFTVTSEHGDIEFGMYSYTSEHEILFQWEDEVGEEHDLTSSVILSSNGNNEYAKFNKFPLEYFDIRLIKKK